MAVPPLRKPRFEASADTVQTLYASMRMETGENTTETQRAQGKQGFLTWRKSVTFQ